MFEYFHCFSLVFFDRVVPSRKCPEKFEHPKGLYRSPKHDKKQLHKMPQHPPQTGVETEEIREGRILAGVRNIWRVFLDILPCQKSKEKLRKA